MKRSILSVLAGYFTMMVGVSGGLAFMMLVAGSDMPREPRPFDGPVWILAFEITVSALAAIAGGWVCARLAPRNPMRHAQVLVGIMGALGIVSVVGELGLKPLWSSIAVVVVGIAGALLGARLCSPRR